MDGIDNGTIANRQIPLNLTVPKSVAILGCGGVGSWVALDMAMVGVKKVILVDFDTVEASNLNRCLFKIKHVGLPKVEAVAELITERRVDCSVYAIPMKYEECNETLKREIASADAVVDCMDVMDVLPKDVEAKARHIVMVYDGYSITLHLNRQREHIWGSTGERTQYRVIPSYVVPPQFMSALITLYLTSDCKMDRQVIRQFDIRKMFGMIEELKRV